MGTIRGKFRVILVCIVRLENRIYAVDLRNRLLSDVIMESLLKKRLPWFSQQKKMEERLWPNKRQKIEAGLKLAIRRPKKICSELEEEVEKCGKPELAIKRQKHLNLIWHV